MAARQYLPLGILALALLVVQMVTSVMGSEFYLTQLTMAAWYSLNIIGLTVLMGYAGQISIGHAAFFAMGGYLAAAMTTGRLVSASGSLGQFLVLSGMATVLKDAVGAEVLRVSPWLSLGAAVVITALVAFVIGIPILKLKGHYLAMATLGFGSIIYRIALGTRVFGEADGISDVPPFVIGGPLSVTGAAESRVVNYYIAWAVVLLGMVLLINLINSRTGRALRAIHGSEEAASAMGVNTGRYKLAVFVLSAVYAAVGGVFLTHFNGGIGPSEASAMKSVRYVAIVAVGGMANLWGALCMGIVLNYLSLRGFFGTYDDVIFGAILIVMMLFFPDGLFRRENFQLAHFKAIPGRLKTLRERLTGKGAAPRTPAE